VLGEAVREVITPELVVEETLEGVWEEEEEEEEEEVVVVDEGRSLDW
jgi:hypothetical protein